MTDLVSHVLVQKTGVLYNKTMRQRHEPANAGCALVLLAVWLAATPSASAQEARPAIQGTIVDAVTQQVIAGARLTLLAGGEDLATTTSAGDGVARLFRIDEGVYQVLVEAPSYQPAVSGDVRVVPDKTAVVLFELSALTLSETVVVTARAARDDRRAPVTTTTYDREEIRRAPGSAGDVLRAVDSLPGVSATGEFAAFSVRGRGPRDNLILVDGIPFDKVVHFDQSIGEQEDLDGGGRFSIFAPNVVQNIAFQPGGFAAAYGGKSGSLLQLEVAEGNPVTPTLSGRLDVAGWEFNYDGPSYVAERTAVLFSARAQDFGRVFTLIGKNDIGAPSLEDVIVKTTTITDRHRLNLLGVYAPERYSRTAAHVVESPEFRNTLVARTAQDSGLLGMNWRWLTGRSSFLTNVLFFRDSDKRSVQGDAFPELVTDPTPRAEDVPVRHDILDVREAEREYGWRGDFSYVTASDHRLSTGARVTRVELDYDIHLDGPWTRFVYDRNDFRPDPSQRFIVLEPEFVNSRFRDTAIRTALYADYGWTVGSRVTVTPGLRWEHDGFADESLWSPRASVTVELDPRTRLTAGGGVFYQHPRFLEVAGNPLNAGLRNERSRQVTLGVSRSLRRDIRLSVEGYYQALDRLVVRPDRTTGLASNTGNGYTTGIDLLVARHLVGRWYGQSTYSLQRSRRDDNLSEGPYDSDFNRPHTLNTLLAYEFDDRWSLATKWRFATGRPTDAFLVHRDVSDDPAWLRFSKEIVATNVDRLPNFHTLNLRLDYRRRLGRLSLITFVDVINVYGHKNVDAIRFQERTGENIRDGLERFPQFGLKLEF